MNRKIKLIWEFKGIEVLNTAKNHSEDLKDFSITKAINFYEVGVKEINEFSAESYIIVDEKDILIYRDLLKPQRGELT